VGGEGKHSCLRVPTHANGGMVGRTELHQRKNPKGKRGGSSAREGIISLAECRIKKGNQKNLPGGGKSKKGPPGGGVRKKISVQKSGTRGGGGRGQQRTNQKDYRTE